MIWGIDVGSTIILFWRTLISFLRYTFDYLLDDMFVDVWSKTCACFASTPLLFAICSRSFRDHFPRSIVYCILVALWLISAPMLAACCSLWAPFRSILVVLGTFANPFWFSFSISILPFCTRSPSSQPLDTLVKRTLHSRATCGTLPKATYAPTPEL